MSPRDLAVVPILPGTTEEFNVGQLSVRYIRELVGLGGATLGVGAMGTLNVVPSSLNAVYGSRTPLGGLVFLGCAPAARDEGMSSTGGADLINSHRKVAHYLNKRAMRWEPHENVTTRRKRSLGT